MTIKKFYLVDLIGKYCGMHYYDEAFAELLRSKGCEVCVLSNFGELGTRAFFPIIFGKNKIVSSLLLLKCVCLLLWHMVTHRTGKYVYMCYGEVYDLLMMLPNVWSKRMYCDVHEVHALKYKDGAKISKFFNWYYTRIARQFIYHSDRTKKELQSMGVKAPMLFVPHFKYTFKKKYDEKKLSADISKVFRSDKTKFLFFGNLSVVKGVDTVIETFCNFSDEKKNNVELVIAGKNVDSVDFSMIDKVSHYYHVFARHINDDELVYLYSSTDYILLPYKKTSQSGIFAMAAYFRKPMILSDVPYFKIMIEEFPSFGKLSTLDRFSNIVEEVIGNNLDSFYQADDCEKFEMKKETEEFIYKLTKK